MQNRFKSWALWVALGALLGFVIKQATGFEAAPIINELLDYLLPVVAGLGIVNNPENSNHF